MEYRQNPTGLRIGIQEEKAGKRYIERKLFHTNNPIKHSILKIDIFTERQAK
jgi:hypothetical protein